LAVGAGRGFILRAEEPVDVVTKDDAALSALYRRLSTAQWALLWHMAAYLGTTATPNRRMRPRRAPTG
jgi:hypothetical protein